MARPLRLEFQDATYHVTSRGNERRQIFRSDRDRRAFLAFLSETTRRFGWSVSAWVLMTNHFHLVIQTPEPNLSRGMQWLNGRYAAWFNARHQRQGHLFQGRFKSFLIEKEAYFSDVLRYVVLNPVRAGMVARPEDYRWSSYRATAGIEPAPEWLDLEAALTPFGGATAIGEAQYRSFVLGRIGLEDPLWNHLVHGVFLGTNAWTKQMRQKVESAPRSTDFPKTQRAVGRPAMHEVLEAAACATGTSVDIIRSKRGETTRALVAWLGWHDGLVTLRSIAASLRLRSEGHVSTLIRRWERLITTDDALLGQLDSARAILRS